MTSRHPSVRLPVDQLIRASPSPPLRFPTDAAAVEAPPSRWNRKHTQEQLSSLLTPFLPSFFVQGPLKDDVSGSVAGIDCTKGFSFLPVVSEVFSLACFLFFDMNHNFPLTKLVKSERTSKYPGC